MLYDYSDHKLMNKLIKNSEFVNLSFTQKYTLEIQIESNTIEGTFLYFS